MKYKTYPIGRMCLAALATLLLTGICSAATITGEVVGISDGDTLTILDSSRRQHKIRLYGIDCPESGQPFGKAAKQHTAQYTFRKTATVTSYDTDRYGRTVGVVFVGGVNINQSLLESGLAWQYLRYCKASFCDDWFRLEKQARYSGLGLWADNDPVAPWQWRKGKRNSSYSQAATGVYTARGGYHGNVKSHKFHEPSCRHYNCKNCVQEFKSREGAVAAGYAPCGLCRP